MRSLIALALTAVLATAGFCSRPYTQFSVGVKSEYLTSMDNDGANGALFHEARFAGICPIANKDMLANWAYYGIGCSVASNKWQSRDSQQRTVPGKNRLSIFYGHGYELFNIQAVRGIIDVWQICVWQSAGRGYFLKAQFMGLGFNWPLSHGHLIADQMISFELPILTYVR